MFKRILSTLALTLSVFDYLDISALAQEPTLNFPRKANPENTTPSFSDFPRNQNQETFPSTPSHSSLEQSRNVTIPKSSAVTVIFCSNLNFDTEQQSSFPVTLSLARPILDSKGSVVAPVNSLVTAKVSSSEDEGIKIEANALVIGGRLIPIKTSSLSVPALTNTEQNDTYAYSYSDQQWEGPVYKVADSLTGWAGEQEILDEGLSDVLRLGLAVASGVSSGVNQPERPEKTKVMEISEGIQVTFSLLSSVSLPPIATQKNPYFANQAEAVSACSGTSRLENDS